MATQLKAVEPTVEESVAALVEQTQANPVAVFTDEAKFSDFYTRLKEETDRHVPDITTASGRKAIASLAFRVTKAKTTLDKAGLGLTEEARQMIATVNASRKKMVTELDQLADDVRRPLTEWEAAEKAREEQCLGILAGFDEAEKIREDDTSASVRERGSIVYQTVLDPDLFRDTLDTAAIIKQRAIDRLLSAARMLKQREDDAAELARLRVAEEERQAREAEERAAREAAEREAEEARQAEQRERDRIEAERIRQEQETARIAEAERQAEERARNAERDRLQREHHEQLATERAERERVEREAREAQEQRDREQAERDRIAAAEREEAERVAEQARKDEANRSLQRRLKTEAKDAIMSCGVSEEAAQKIVLAIRAREIPHICWVASAQTEA